jgi:hypothetical protein
LTLNDEAPLKNASDTNAVPMNPERNFRPLREAAFAVFLPLAAVPADVGKVIPARSMHFLKITLQNTSRKRLAFHDISRKYTEHRAAYRVNTHV